ncbi:MAG: PQQ-dependent sugar dehydrogenase [Nitrososphaeraceae archaeon]
MIHFITIQNLIIGLFIVSFSTTLNYAYSQTIPNDPSLNTEIIAEDFSKPTGMVFLGNDILVIEKGGNVKLFSNDTKQQSTILQFDVDTKSERGLLGVESNGNDVFFYFTDADSDPIKNRVFKYTWDGIKLSNPQMLLDLPALPGPNHDAGKLVLERDRLGGSTENLYVVIGDLNHDGILQNQKSGDKPDDTGVIFRINALDGSVAENNPFATDTDFSKYFAYGIRNSFGLTLDSESGYLWSTENGPGSYDEINIVKPGFNGGWSEVMGPIDRTNKNEYDLVIIPGAEYTDPVLSWEDPVALTDIEFLNSSNLGTEYLNKMFVGDYKNGNLYYLSLDPQREDLDIKLYPEELHDRVVDGDDESSSIIFGTGFGGISDIETGPEGDLYILSIEDEVLYKISKN